MPATRRRITCRLWSVGNSVAGSFGKKTIRMTRNGASIGGLGVTLFPQTAVEPTRRMGRQCDLVLRDHRSPARHALRDRQHRHRLRRIGDKEIVRIGFETEPAVVASGFEDRRHTVVDLTHASRVNEISRVGLCRLVSKQVLVRHFSSR